MTQRPACLEEDPAFITRPPSDVLARLFPEATLLHLEACEVDETAVQITLRVQSTQRSAPCPRCATPAQRIHSDYGRTLADLPWAQYRVDLQRRVRTWFCRNRSCSRRIFTSACPRWRPPGRAVPCGWPSAASPSAWLWRQGRDASGPPVGPGVSRNTLLRLLRKLPLPAVPTPRVLGVDDFALRKRHTSGMILGDLEHRQPVTLLPERTAETVAQWLQEPPGVEVIARDRSRAYARGHARAQRQPSRWQTAFMGCTICGKLWHHVFTTSPPGLQCRQCPGAPAARGVARWNGRSARATTRRAPHARAAAGGAAPAIPAGAAYADLTLHQQGWTGAAMAQHGGRVSGRCGAISGPPRLRDASAAAPRGTGCSTPLHRLCSSAGSAGCSTAMRLFREIRQRGYGGGYGVVAA